MILKILFCLIQFSNAYALTTPRASEGKPQSSPISVVSIEEFCSQNNIEGLRSIPFPLIDWEGENNSQRSTPLPTYYRVDGSAYDSKASTPNQDHQQEPLSQFTGVLNSQNLTKPFAKKPFTEESTKSSENKKHSIAIVGAGGAGCILSSLLANVLEKHNLTNYFNIELFEKENDILPATAAFSVAAVLHAEGNEYPSSEETRAYCQKCGRIFKQMFPSLYSSDSQPIIFAYTSEVNHEKNADQDTLNEIKARYGFHIQSAVISTVDQPMKNFERNILLRNYVRSKNQIITTKENTKIDSIYKNDSKYRLKIDISESNISGDFDFIVLSGWNNVPDLIEKFITSTKNDEVKPIEYTVEDRAVAIVNARDMSLENKTPFFQIPNGGMFMPISDDWAWMYHCSKGGSYPLNEDCGIDENEKDEYGRRIVGNFKEMFDEDVPFSKGLDDLQYCGAIKTVITRERSSPLTIRTQPDIDIIDENIYSFVPLKATYIPLLALQIIHKFFENVKKRNIISESTINTIISDINRFIELDSNGLEYLTINLTEGDITPEMLRTETCNFLSVFVSKEFLSPSEI